MPKPSMPRTVTKILAGVVLIVLCLPAIAQQKSRYNLLWRISGNGLKQPSYLFGTMHVKDKRVFNFSDSVMLAIQRCDAFATEVHPDSMIQRMFSMIGNEKDSVRDLHKLLNKEQYDALAKRFKDHNGYDMGKVDPMFVEASLDGQEKKQDDMATFVDAHLYGVARTLSKKVYGVEKASDQFDSYFGPGSDLKDRLLDLIDVSDEDQKKGEDHMVRLYAAGNIDDIYDFLSENNFEDPLIKTRNKTMLASMVRIMANESLFTAVGVAHLPGDDGLISLLRKAGYTVTAVPATFTGVAARYKVDQLKMPWQTYKNDALGYSMDLPGAPVKTNVFGDNNAIIYPDLGTGVVYGSFVFPNIAFKASAKPEAIVQRIVDGYKADSTKKLISAKSTIVNGRNCTDVVISTRNGYERMNIYLANHSIYLLYIGNDKETIYQPAATRFFNSFKSFNPAASPQPAGWITFTDTTAAFSVRLPGAPQKMVKETPSKNTVAQEPFKMNVWIASDTVNDHIYLVRQNDYPRGYYLADKQSFFESIKTDYAGHGEILRGPSVIHKGGLEGRSFLLKMNDFYMQMHVFLRGNRVYLLMRQGTEMPKDDADKDGFFDSISFLPFKTPEPYTFAPAGQYFSVKLPAGPLIKHDTVERTSYITSSSTASATNPNSGGYYYMEYSQISPYYRIPSVDSLYSKLIKRLVTYTDTLLKTGPITIDGKPAREFLTREKEGGDSVRRIILINNGHIYYLASRVSGGELHSEASRAYYSSLHVLPGAPEADISSLKGAKIKEALASKDSSVYQDAVGALTYYDFDKTELPVIYDLLKQQYPDDTTANIRSKLIDKLGELNDSGTGEWLQQYYASLDGRDDLRADILAILPKADKTKGYGRYLDLLTKGKPLELEYKYNMFSVLTDSLGFAAANFNRILPLVDEPGYRPNILRVAAQLSTDDDHPQYLQLIRANSDKLFAHATEDLNTFVAKPDSVSSTADMGIYQYLQLMKALKSGPLTDKFTSKLITDKPKSYYYDDAVIARIEARLPVTALSMKPLLDSLGTRYEILKALYDNKRLSLAPPQYTQTSAVAKTCVYNYLTGETDDDDNDQSPQNIALLGSVVAQSGTFYAFKFTLSGTDDAKTQIAIWGPYKPGTPFAYKGYQSYTEWTELKTNWQQQARKLIPGLLKANKAEEAARKKN